MNCALCHEKIENYSAELHNLRLDAQRAVDICDECSRRFSKWQGDKLARLFPTRAMKKLRRKSE